MKKILLVGLILVLVVLDWLALDDITTGLEPDFILEYAILLFSLLIFGILGFVIFRSKAKK